METSELFYVIGSITLIAITVLLAILVYELYITLKAVQSAIAKANDIAGNLNSVTTGMQFGFWALLSRLFSSFSGRR